MTNNRIKYFQTDSNDNLNFMVLSALLYSQLTNYENFYWLKLVMLEPFSRFLGKFFVVLG
jgi:hypothetical protein